jgi:hypothetical protein
VDAVQRTINAHRLATWEVWNEHAHLDGGTLVDLHGCLLLFLVLFEDLPEICVLGLFTVLYLARLYLILLEILCVLLL